MKKELRLAGPGEFEMQFTGSFEVPNKFGTKSRRNVFENGTVQANVLTGDRMIAGGELDQLAEKMMGRPIKIGEEVNLDSLVGESFRVTVRTVNGFDRVISVERMGEGGAV